MPKQKAWEIRGPSDEVMDRLQESLKAIGMLACHWEDISAIRERLGLSPIDHEGYPVEQEEEECPSEVT